MKPIIPWLQKLVYLSLLIFLFLTWNNLGRDYLFDWDEGIYAQIGSEMVVSGDYLTPTWNGELWLEKPPLIAWVTALGVKIAGSNELGARLLMPLFAGLTLLAIFRIGQYLGGTQMGAASMAILGYFNLFLARARSLNTDGMLLAGITWSVWLLLINGPAWVVGIVMGLSIMAKGPAGVLAILITLPLLMKKPKPYLLSTFYFLLLTVLPWHLYAYLTHGMAFVTPYLLEQVVRRATVPIEFHLESRWFYFQFIHKDLGLGVVLVSLTGYALMLKDWLEKKKLNNLHLILYWLILPLIIFTLAKTRLSWYILPVYPAIALSIGYALTYFTTAKKSLAVVSILVVGMLTQMLYHTYQYVDPTRPPSPLTPLLQVSQGLSIFPGSQIAMLVSPNERVAQAILPEDQTISSSFRYGGAPSVVWYSTKQVTYYYNYDDFVKDSQSDPNISAIIVSTLDQDKVPPGFKLVSETQEYLGYVKEAVYALR